MNSHKTLLLHTLPGSTREINSIVIRFTALGQTLSRKEKVKDEFVIISLVVEHTMIPIPNILGPGTCAICPETVNRFRA